MPLDDYGRAQSIKIKLEAIPMTLKFFKSALLSLALTSAALAGIQISHASPPFDGRWKVTVSASGENCSSRYTVPIKVAAGQVSYAGLFSADAKGKIRPDGALKVSFAHRRDIVNATGALKGESGSGQWISPTQDCSGTWVAQKV